jgi:hypothetical protein
LSPTSTTALLKALDTNFSLKDLGELHFFLGIEITKNAAGLLLSQGKYAEDLLKRAGMTACKPINTPLYTLERLSAHEGTLIGPNDATSYHSLVGGLQYLTLTRPDIGFSVNKVCQYVHAPTTLHLVAVKRILQYVRGTIDMGLQIVKSPSMHVHGFLTLIGQVLWMIGAQPGLCYLLRIKSCVMERSQATYHFKIKLGS